MASATAAQAASYPTQAPLAVGEPADTFSSRAPYVAYTSSKVFWLVNSAGQVSYPSYGDATGVALAAPMVSIAATPDGKGYWLAGADGGVFAYGDARFLGSLAQHRLNAPIVAIAAAPSGEGYWLVGADGGVFAYGSARFHGSATGTTLSAPVTSISVTPSGNGYLLAAADGGVFAYGDAQFHGSATNVRLAAPIVGIAVTQDGRGYHLAGRDGGIFAYGDAPYYGSGCTPPIIGINDEGGPYGVTNQPGHGCSWGIRLA